MPNNTHLTNESVRQRYNEDVVGKYQKDYEFHRWFATAKKRSDYSMVYRVLEHHLALLSFERMLELGPGPGTWTPLFFRANPQAAFDLVDISDAMREQFELSMRSASNVAYHVTDVMEFTSDRPYDLVASVRSFEYLEDKSAVLRRVHTLLADGGAGIILTKLPTRSSANNSTPNHHRGRVAPRKLVEMLEREGFVVVGTYPAVVRTSFAGMFLQKISERLFRAFFKKRLSWLSALFSESYVVVFKKRA